MTSMKVGPEKWTTRKVLTEAVKYFERLYCEDLLGASEALDRTVAEFLLTERQEKLLINRLDYANLDA